jgi:hypothetical protein
MKNKFLFTLSLATCLLSGYPSTDKVQANQPLQPSSSIWKPFAPSEGGFQVLMPGTPTHPTPQSVNLLVNNRFAPEYIYKASIGDSSSIVPDASFSVSYTDLPRNPYNLTEINNVFHKNILRMGCLPQWGNEYKKRNIKLEIRDIRLGDSPGMEFKCLSLYGFAKIQVRQYLVGRRLYIIGAAVELKQEEKFAQTIETFFNSFQLNNS